MPPAPPRVTPLAWGGEASRRRCAGYGYPCRLFPLRRRVTNLVSVRAAPLVGVNVVASATRVRAPVPIPRGSRFSVSVPPEAFLTADATFTVRERALECVRADRRASFFVALASTLTRPGPGS